MYEDAYISIYIYTLYIFTLYIYIYIIYIYAHYIYIIYVYIHHTNILYTHMNIYIYMYIYICMSICDLQNESTVPMSAKEIHGQPAPLRSCAQDLQLRLWDSRSSLGKGPVMAAAWMET